MFVYETVFRAFVYETVFGRLCTKLFSGVCVRSAFCMIVYEIGCEAVFGRFCMKSQIFVRVIVYEAEMTEWLRRRSREPKGRGSIPTRFEKLYFFFDM